MVHFPPLPSLAYEFSERYFGMSQSGFPHSEIPGSKTACVSPRLIAACHVLHRLLAPRHSPYALSSLTKCSLHLTFLPFRPESRIGHEYVVKKTTDCRIFSCQKTVADKLSAYLPDRIRDAVKKTWLVENTGIEPVTSWLQTRRSPS
jgi:hypothetical protein